MDYFSNVQYEPVISFATDLRAAYDLGHEDTRTPQGQWRQWKREYCQHPQPAARRALYWLLAANMPLHYARFSTQARAHRLSHANFQDTFRARSIAYIFPSSRQSLLKGYVAENTGFALEAFDRIWALSPATWREGKWWSWLTAGFTHSSDQHLLNNMYALFTAGSICTQIPGMTAEHMLSLIHI